jgi:iron complex outermembrane receptor protein
MSQAPAHRRFRLVALAAAVTATGLVSAQERKPANDAESEQLSNTVTVTAQRRREKLQDVPMAASAITARELETRGIGNVADLSALAPNLQVSLTPGNSTAAQIAIRGSVTTNPALFWEPTVGMYVDGVYVGKMQGSVFDLVDLERVEVLRGPQGTLYGRNTLAGAVNLVTRKPSGEFGGTAQAELGSFNARLGKLALDLPAFGLLKASVGLRSDKRDGWVTTAGGSSVADLNDRNSTGGRLALNLAVGNALEFDYRFDNTRTRQHSRYSQVIRSTVDQDFGFPSGIVVRQGRQNTAAIDGPSFERVDIDGHALTGEWKLGPAGSLKYLYAHRAMVWQDALDLDGSPVAFAHTQRLSDYKQASHELQWVGSSGPLAWVAGAYHFNDDGFTSNPQSYFYGASNFDSRYGFTTRANAVFGQVDYQLTPALTLTGGLRHNKETKTIGRQLTGGATVLIPAGTGASAEFSSTTPLLSLGWKLSNDVSAYARYAEGFKGGGFNGEAQDTVETLTPYKPEKQRSFELGLKSTLLGGKAQVNLAVFDNRSQDLQQAVFTAQGSAASNIRNVGRASTRGLEIETAYRPNSMLRLQANYGHLKAAYSEYMELGVNVADNRAVVHAPRHTLNLVADANLGKGAWGTWRALADYAYTSSYYLYPYQLRRVDPGSAVAANTQVAGVGLLNLRVALADIALGSAASGELALSVRNATDQKHIGNLIDFGPGFGNLTQAYYIDPRTVSLSFTARW